MSIPDKLQPFWLTPKNLRIQTAHQNGGYLILIKSCMEFVSATNNGGYYRVKHYACCYDWDTNYTFDDPIYIDGNQYSKKDWYYWISRCDILTKIYSEIDENGRIVESSLVTTAESSFLKEASDSAAIGQGGALLCKIPVGISNTMPQTTLEVYGVLSQLYSNEEWYEIPSQDASDNYIFLPYNNTTLYAKTEFNGYFFPEESNINLAYFREVSPTVNYLTSFSFGTFPKSPNIQNPSLVYPSNTFADATEDTETSFRFKFNGSCLGAYRLYIKDNVSGKFVHRFAHDVQPPQEWAEQESWITPMIYNGDFVSIDIELYSEWWDSEKGEWKVDITNGGQYIWYMELYEYDQKLVDEWQEQSSSLSLVQYYADNALPFITSSYYFETLAPMAMELFTDPTDVFVDEELPSKNLEVYGVYSHPQNVPLKWYQFILEDEDRMETIKDTGRIYSERIKFTYDGFLFNRGYNLTIKAENQKNQTLELIYFFNTTYEIPERFGDYECSSSVMSDIQAIALDFDLLNIQQSYEVDGFRIFRSKKFDTYETLLGDYTVEELSQKALVPDTGAEYCIYDHLTRSNESYTYSIYPYILDSDTQTPIFIKPYTVINDITQENIAKTDWQGYSLIPLEKEGYNKFTIPSTYGRQYPFWTFFVDREEDEITQNQDKEIFTTFASFPKISVGMLNYETGSLSFKLGNTACDGRYLEPYQLLEKWKKFVALNKICLLKNPKGDMKIISIDQNTTRKYMNEASNYYIDDNGSVTAYPTTISFSYTEIAKVEDVDIRVSLLDGDQYL